MNDKVVPINPSIPNLQQFSRVDHPYSGPADAVHHILEVHNFDQMVVNKNWVELTIVARFSDTGAMFHTVQARGVVMIEDVPAGDRPGFQVLIFMAQDNNVPNNFYVNKATIDQMHVLNQELADASPEELYTLASGEEEEIEKLVKEKGWQKSHGILNDLFTQE